MVKYLIFDSGGIINMAENCLVSVFRDLNKVFQGEFLITDTVKYEIIDHPMRIKKFEWGAIRIQALLDEEIIRLAEEEGEIVDKKELEQKTNEVMSIVNNALVADGKPVHLIERGESECMALSLILSKKGIENAVVIDERTARMICENPENLEKIMESKLRAKIEINLQSLDIFRSIKVLRSTELIYMAFKKNLVDSDRRKLEAMLYALKFGGCSVSDEEVQVMKKG